MRAVDVILGGVFVLITAYNIRFFVGISTTPTEWAFQNIGAIFAWGVIMGGTEVLCVWCWITERRASRDE